MRLTGISTALIFSVCSLIAVADDRGTQETADSKSSDAAAPKQARKLPKPKAADSDAPLPEGWPGGTEPGKIEVKSYPVYRSAVAKAKNTSSAADGVLFFSLFNHISRKGVEMTAPVVMTYSDSKMIENRKEMGEMSMEFLYQSTKIGETGKGVGAVQVVDHEPRKFVCIGVQGESDRPSMASNLVKLRTWLEEHKGEWVADGEPRVLGYHGPMTPVNQRLWELQIPVKAVDTKN
ncbi:MAG: heme-binding protein [Isosphaeraceae bacterium]|nr:heme-binding protein [Isosphaeraceae bacterium]